jgi:hypothetical protein
MNVLYYNNIAIVSKITVIPVIKSTTVFNQAYLDVSEWLPSEAAYYFIKSLKSSDEASIDDSCFDDIWYFNINTKPYITKVEILSKFTTVNHLVEQRNEEVKYLKLLIDEEREEWQCIEKDLSEMLAYQNCEYELCL